MLKLIICASFLIIAVFGNGELSILQNPKSIDFKGHEHIRESYLPDVFSAILGFSTEQDTNWPALFITDPFNLPKAIVTIAVDGVSTLDISKGRTFPLHTDLSENGVYDALRVRIEDHYPYTNQHIVRIDLSDGLEALPQSFEFQGIKSLNIKTIPHNFLKATVEEDKNFLEELAFLDAVAEQVNKGAIKRTGDSPDMFWFKVSALHALSDLHGSNSSTTKEAKQLLFESILRVNNAFEKLYSGQVIVTVVTSDASHTRRIARSVSTREEEINYDQLNLAQIYSTDYPAIFNIILWFGVVFVFSLLAITIFIANMDPGRDSIIYRMTSTRMKKDN